MVQTILLSSCEKKASVPGEDTRRENPLPPENAPEREDEVKSKKVDIIILIPGFGFRRPMPMPKPEEGEENKEQSPEVQPRTAFFSLDSVMG